MSENWPALIGATILPNVGGIIGGIFSRNEIKTWYETLQKPEWRPPNWAFGPVWTTLYSGIGYASYLVYRDGGGFSGDARLPLIVYGTNLALNWAWTPIFFNAHRLDLAFYEILLVDVTAVATAFFFHRVNAVAGGLVIPYCLWLGLATALSYTIFKDNTRDNNTASGPKITEIKNQ